MGLGLRRFDGVNRMRSENDLQLKLWNEPQRMNEKGLKHHIPRYIASLKGWIDESPKQANSFVYYLDTAFNRADELGIIAQEDIRNLFQEYSLIKPKAEKYINKYQRFI